MIGSINITGIGFGVIGIANDPPANPVQGADYGVGSSPTGAWVGYEGKVARADASQGDGWLMFDNVALIYDQSTRKIHDLQNGVWTPVPAGGVVTALGDLADVELDGSGSVLKRDAEGVWRDEAFPVGGGSDYLGGVKLRKAGSQSVPNLTVATATWDAPVYDPLGAFSGPSTVIVPEGASKVGVSLYGMYGPASAGVAELYIQIGGVYHAAISLPPMPGSAPRRASVAVDREPVNPGDTVKAILYHNVGSSLQFNTEGVSNMTVSFFA